jgi:demethylspheroidene O-methyltransferase
MIPRSWLDAWTAWRNRLVSSPSFQRWAAGFFLTRPIAHQSADRLFGLVAGFVYSQVLLACVQLRLPEKLAEGPKTTKLWQKRWICHSILLRGFCRRLNPLIW